MREPKRLLSNGATDFERQLLKAVINERPSALMRSRMQQGLGLVGPIAWAGNAKAFFGSLATKGGISAALGGVVAAGGLAAAVGFGRLAEDPGSDSSMPSAAPVAMIAAAEVAPPPPAPEVVAPASVVSPESAELARNSQLREEIALLDAVRVALQQGARTRALAELSRYDERFPDGILSREANLLRRRSATRSARR
jgi:hypothetical protein